MPAEAALRALSPPPAPPDFDAFWRELYVEAAAVRVAPRLEHAGNVDDVEVYDLWYTSLGGVAVGGWLTLPAGRIRRGVVVGHGYGGRDAPDLDLPTTGAAAIFPCARGLSRSRHPSIPDSSERHVLHGIENRRTYVHGGCAADVWCAATALLELVPSAAERLDYIGASFGGGIGALALAADPRFTAAQLVVPSFGHHPLRLAAPCAGSGEAVRRHHAEHPEVVEVLGYFDAATAATRIHIPTLVAPALHDPVVPPGGQWAVANALAGPRELFPLTTGHIDDEPALAEQRALQTAAVRFFAS